MGHADAFIKLITQAQARRVVEVGVWKGRLLRGVLRAIGGSIDRYFAVDPWHVLEERHGFMSTIPREHWDQMHARVVHDMQWFGALRVIRMTSVDAARTFLPGSVDLVYIDASHKLDDTIEDIRAWLPVVRSGGVIGGHDYGIGAEKGHRVKEAVATALPDYEITLGANTMWWTTKR